MRALPLLVASLLLPVSAATAQPTRSASDGTDPLAALERCRAIADGAQRLNCFDAASQAVLAGRAKGDFQLVNRRELGEVRRNLFGFSLPRLPLFRGDRSQEDSADEVESQVLSARHLGYGKYRVTIAAGNAVWETTETFENMDPPAAGQKVVIKRGTLGSYMMRVNGQRGVKSRRIG